MLGKASSNAGRRGTYYATYLQQVSYVTEVCCPGIPVSFAHYMRHYVTIALESLEKKKSIHWIITPSPSTYPPLPAICLAQSDYKRSSLTTQLVYLSYNFFIFCPICLKFSHKFLHTYSFILSIIEKLDNLGKSISLNRHWLVAVNMMILLHLAKFTIN